MADSAMINLGPFHVGHSLGMPHVVEEDGDEDRFTGAPETTAINTSITLASTVPTNAVSAEPEPSPTEHADPKENRRKSYDARQRTTHVRLDNDINSFCKEIGNTGDVLGSETVKKATKELPFDGMEARATEVVLKLEVQAGCD